MFQSGGNKRWLHAGSRAAIALVTTATLLGAPLTAVFAAGEGSVGVGISPPTTEITANPGERVTRTFVVDNKGNGSKSFNITLNNFFTAGENGESAYEPTGNGGLADWITLSPKSISLESGQSAEIKANIAVPNNVSAGGYYATIFAVSTDFSENFKGSGAHVGQVVGANIILKVLGNVVERAAIAEFSVAKSRLKPSEPVDFTVRVRNNGTIHLRPDGVVEILKSGVKVAEVPVNPDGGLILPNSTRRFPLTLDKTLTSGSYSARLAVRYGSGQVVAAPEINFSVVSESQMLTWVSLFLGALVIVLLYTLMSGRERMKIKLKS